MPKSAAGAAAIAVQRKLHKFGTKGIPMQQKPDSAKGEVINDKLIRRIADSLKGIKFGHVLITVHNNKVVQIDRTEKNRCEIVVQEIDGGGI